jgi:recombination protein RecT
LEKVNQFSAAGQIKLPPNYSAENALRSAWLIIQETQNLSKQPALSVCSTESIANALMDMVLQGLNPVKKQCYFIVYGSKLTLQKSYIGNIAISKRIANVKDVRTVPIYKNDIFKYEINTETGRKKIIEHGQELDNIDPQNVVGAYAIITENDGKIWCEVMNMKQIKASWEMGNAKGTSKAHINFADEMACKTVANRALKIAIGSTDDADLFEDDLIEESRVTADIKNEITTNANQTESPIGFDEEDATSANNAQVQIEAPIDAPEVTMAEVVEVKKVETTDRGF